jgi:hypothetical protein
MYSIHFGALPGFCNRKYGQKPFCGSGNKGKARRLICPRWLHHFGYGAWSAWHTPRTCWWLLEGCTSGSWVPQGFEKDPGLQACTSWWCDSKIHCPSDWYQWLAPALRQAKFCIAGYPPSPGERRGHSPGSAIA